MTRWAHLCGKYGLSGSWKREQKRSRCRLERRAAKAVCRTKDCWDSTVQPRVRLNDHDTI
jgi:hypothetical protein